MNMPRNVRVLCPSGHFITEVEVHGDHVDDNPNRFTSPTMRLKLRMVCRHKQCGYTGSFSLHGFARDMERVNRAGEYRLTN
jgi:hypothetical protein